jgi:RNA polymerase sigma-70 factor (ECF subfamily)
MSADPALGDPELLAALAAGDLSAMRLLYDRHAPWLSARLGRRCNNPDAVADVLQDTFMALWKGAERWRGDGEFGAWLWGIAARRLVSRLRGHQEALVLPLAEIASNRQPEPSAEEKVLLGVEYGDLGNALLNLSPGVFASGHGDDAVLGHRGFHDAAEGTAGSQDPRTAADVACDQFAAGVEWGNNYRRSA